MNVLTITLPYDSHSAAVHWALLASGHQSDLLFLHDLPEQLHLTLAFDGPPAIRPLHGNRLQKRYDVVWARRTSPVQLAAQLHPSDVPIARSTVAHALAEFLLNGYPDAVWVNDQFHRVRARSKLAQLRAARSVGFEIPPTIVSNDVDEIARFVGASEGGVIIKTFAQYAWRLNRKTLSLTTTKFDPSLLSEPEPFQYCPSIYQHYVDKKFELRVTVMGDSVVAARIDSQSNPATEVDWRHYMVVTGIPVVPAELSANVAEKCVQVIRALGLRFGCLDIIVTPDDRCVFLEVNEMGQFLWKEVRNPDIPALASFVSFIGSGGVGVRELDESISWKAFEQSGAKEEFDEASASHKVSRRTNAPFEAPDASELVSERVAGKS